jgi:hypothetical protein
MVFTVRKIKVYSGVDYRGEQIYLWIAAESRAEVVRLLDKIFHKGYITNGRIKDYWFDDAGGSEIGKQVIKDPKVLYWTNSGYPRVLKKWSERP